MSDTPVSIAKAPEISIIVGGEKLTGWTGFNVVRALDAAADAFAFSLPFDPTPENVERFRPYSPGVIEIRGDNERFLRGYFEHVTASTQADSRTIELQGRSTTGVLVEWSAGHFPGEVQKLGKVTFLATEAYKENVAFEFSGMTFNQIAVKVAFPNEVKAFPDTPVIEDVAIEPGTTCFKFLASLAAANGYLGIPTPAGALHYRRDLGTTPTVVDLIEGQSPVISVSTTHDMTKRFHVYKVVASSTGNPGVEAFAYDKALAPNIRGSLVVEPQQQSTDYQQAANFARARGLIDSYNTAVIVTGFAFRNKAGAQQFWKAGDVIRLYAPGAFILKPSKLIVRRATFRLDESGGQITTLDLALPEVFSGGYPEVVPWED